MYVTFPGYIRYGKLYATDFDVEVDLTEDEYARLRKSAETHWDMYKDDDITDIYDKAYSASLKADLDVMRGDKSLLAEKMAWHLNISVPKAAKREYTDDEILDMLENEGIRVIEYPVALRNE